MHYQRNVSPILHATIGFCLWGLLSISAHGQLSDPAIAAQAPILGSGHNYIGIGAETVNPADGSLSFDLPLDPPTGRELMMSFGIRYSATDQFHLFSIGSGPLWWTPNLVTPYEVAGWSYQLPTYTGQVYAHFAENAPPPHNTPIYCDITQNYLFTGLDGVRRNLAVSSSWVDPAFPDPIGACVTSPINGSLGSNLHGWLLTTPTYTTGQGPAYPPLTVTDPSGTTYQFPGGFGLPVGVGSNNSDGEPSAWGLLAQTITDRNGNQISLANTEVMNGAISYAANSYMDTLGRQVVSWTGLGGDGDTLSIAGLPANILLNWGTATVDFTEGGQVASGSSLCSLSPNSQAPATIRFLTQITLPNGQTYTFTPDSTNYGRVGKITFPGRGYVRYVWGLSRSAIVNLECSTAGQSKHEYWIVGVPTITDRFVSYDGSTEALHQHFGYNTTFSATSWMTKTTTVTSTGTGQSLITTYSYVPMVADFGPADISVWTIPVVPVENTVQYQDGSSGSTLRIVNKTWTNTMIESGDQTVLDNGQGMTKLYCYDGNEQVVQIYEYGFQSDGSYPGDPPCVSSTGLTSSALGPLERQTTTLHHTFSTGTHIVNAPDSVTVADGSGNTAKQTTYTYTDTVQPSGTAVGLVAPPGVNRGNVASVSWLASAGNSVTTS